MKGTYTAALIVSLIWVVCTVFDIYREPTRLSPIRTPDPYKIKVYDNVKIPTDINSYMKLTHVS